MCGIGPYRDKTFIDFSKFNNSGIFLITGPTGSGKTTIFDGITFALFGETSGSVREKSSLKSDFLQEDTKVYVRLVFEYRGNIYTVNRNPKYLRARKRGGGYTEEKENAVIEKDNSILASGVKETNEKVEEILGIDFKQFKQIAMIAQGEFLDLLVAKSDERTKIFRDIFDTKIYDTITVMLKQKVREAAGTLKQINSRIEENIKLSMVPEGMDNLDGLKNLVKKDGQELKNIENVIEKIKVEIYRLTAESEKKSFINSQIIQLNKYIDEYEKLISEQKTIDDNKEQIDRGEKYLRVYVKEKEYLTEKKYYEDYSKQLGEIEISLKELLNVEKKLKEDSLKCRMLSEEVDNLQDQIRGFNNNIDELKELDEKLKIYRQKQQAYIEIRQKKLAAKMEYEKAEDLYKASAAGILAMELLENKPCPVCGATHHPNPATISHKVPDREFMNESKARCEGLGKKEDAAFEEVTSIKGAIEATLNKYGFNWVDKIITKENLDSIILNNENEKNKSEETLKNHRKVIEENEKLIKVNSRELATTQALGDNIKKKLEENTRDILYKEFLYELEKNGFKDYKEYTQGEITEAYKEELKVKVNNYYNTKKSLQDAIGRLQQEYGTAEYADLDQIKEDINRVKAEEKALTDKADILKNRLSVNKQAFTSLNDAMKEKAELEAYYGVIADLEKTAKGENGRKLVFEQYVLSSYFDNILKAANLRLSKMTNERYVLYRVEEVGSIKTKDGLEIEVLDNYTGRKRSVKTLSGGESFKTALALALGMSDTIERNAGGIELGTLFIDEGFGTLDEESLNQAIEALTMVTKNHRLIGIISHVPELKERIGDKIQVERTSTGSRIIQTSR